MTLTPTAMHETLDERGLLNMAHGSGTYALRVHTPRTREGVAQAFREQSDALPPREALQRLTAERVAYVGASGDVYARLQDHADGDVRQATFLQAFPPVDIVGVWPSAAPFESEYNRATKLAREGWAVYCDGEVF